MLEQYFLRPTTVDRIRSKWLAPQIEHYVEWMHTQKYAGGNITRRIALLCHFADFARTNGVTDLASASSLVEKFGDPQRTSVPLLTTTCDQRLTKTRIRTGLGRVLAPRHPILKNGGGSGR